MSEEGDALRRHMEASGVHSPTVLATTLPHCSPLLPSSFQSPPRQRVSLPIREPPPPLPEHLTASTLSFQPTPLGRGVDGLVLSPPPPRDWMEERFEELRREAMEAVQRQDASESRLVQSSIVTGRPLEDVVRRRLEDLTREGAHEEQVSVLEWMRDAERRQAEALLTGSSPSRLTSTLGGGGPPSPSILAISPTSRHPAGTLWRHPSPGVAPPRSPSLSRAERLAQQEEALRVQEQVEKWHILDSMVRARMCEQQMELLNRQLDALTR